MISVIVPAYKAVKYIDECISSLQGAEILVGVDGCQETLNHLLQRKDIKLFFFPENVGPYIIKNTLIDEASNENVLFFDSDDVLVKGCLDEIETALEHSDYVKLNYINFYNKINTTGHKMNDAVIAIKKNVFNSLNGFEPWRCAADTEFANRLVYNNIKYKELSGVSYYRRLHGENLTMRKDTGHNSPIRNSYIQLISKKQQSGHWNNPEIKKIKAYVNYTTTSQ